MLLAVDRSHSFFLSAVYRDRDCLAVGEEPPPTAGFIQQHIPAVLSAEPDCVLPALNASVEPRQEEEGGVNLAHLTGRFSQTRFSC